VDSLSLDHVRYRFGHGTRRAKLIRSDSHHIHHTDHRHTQHSTLRTLPYARDYPSHPTLPDVDSFHGNEIQIPKPPNRTRFLTKNVHHVSTNSTDDELRIHFVDQHRLEIDFFGITEHKLDTHQYQVRQAFRDSVHHIFQQYKIELGSSELQTVSTYKPGRTAIIAQGDATGRITAQDSDKHGRWSYLHLQGRDDKTITYITAYQVCAKPTNLHQGITAYHQQIIAFKREKRTNTNPRHNFNLSKSNKNAATQLYSQAISTNTYKPTTPASNKLANNVSCSTFGNKNSLISQSPLHI
jgi:hypothetical protein